MIGFMSGRYTTISFCWFGFVSPVFTSISDTCFYIYKKKKNKFKIKNYFLIFQTVHPLIQVPNQLVGAPVGTDVTLVCNAEASPKAINYWQKENGEYI